MGVILYQSINLEAKNHTSHKITKLKIITLQKHKGRNYRIIDCNNEIINLSLSLSKNDFIPTIESSR